MTDRNRTADIEPRDLCWHPSERMERMLIRYARSIAGRRAPSDPRWHEMEAPEIGSAYIGA